MSNIPKGYKQTEVGVIPNDWEVKKLGDYVKITSGESHQNLDLSPMEFLTLKLNSQLPPPLAVVVDFYCSNLKLVIEIDGESHEGKFS